MVVRQLIHIERFPRLHVSRKDIAGEDTVPEIEFLQFAFCVVAPNDTDIRDVEMIVGLPVHAAVAFMVSVGNDHAREIVGVLGLDQVLDVIDGCVKRFFPRHRLFGLVRDLAYILNIPGQVVSVPERHQQPQKTCCNEDVIKSHRSVQDPFTKISVVVKRTGTTLAASDK